MNTCDHFTCGELIGMDHPLIMVWTQSRIHASPVAKADAPTVEAQPAIKQRMQSLFAQLALAPIDSMRSAKRTCSTPETAKVAKPIPHC